MRRRSFVLGATLALLLQAPLAQAQQPLKVVATFSILGDLVRNVGGDRVSVTNLVGPGGDAHVYAPTPADAKTVSDAKLVVTNGLGFEGWMARLTKAAGGKATVVVATKGIAPRKSAEAGHDHGNTDPHAWQSVANAKVYVANIRDALVAADPAGADSYRANATAYTARLDALEREVREAVAKLPADRRKIITTHDAFGYFAAAYGVAFVAPRGVSTESEVTAKDVATIIRQVRAEKIPAVFIENVTDPRLMQRIAAETGAKLGGTLYSDALTDEKGSAPTYIDLIRHNIKALTSALTS
jgi:zinc/manganese transport system substrate-binding protein